MLTVVTGNSKKFAEMQQALSAHGIAAQRENVDLPELQTLDHEAIVRAKAQKAFEFLQRPVLVDDSGWYVERFNAFPGPFSKYVYQMIGYHGLFALLKEGEPAYFRCFVAYMDAELEEPQVFTADFRGAVNLQFHPNTTEFGEMPYVPLFVPTEQPDPNVAPKPLSRWTPEERHNDHRHKALAQFATWYQARYNESVID